MPSSLDIENHAALLHYLRAANRIEKNETPQMRDLSGGVSNRAVWLGRPNGEAWVLKQALEKLRVPVDWFSDPRRIHREALGMRHLSTLSPLGTITPLVFEDAKHHLLAMQAVPQPHDNWKTLLLQGVVRADQVQQFAHLLGAIHGRAEEQRDHLAPLFDEYSFFETLRLEPYYEYSAAQVPEAGAFLHGLIQSTRARRQTLVHGDYSPKNILIYQGRLILLDHEVIHWGDPAFDVGFALAHLLSKAHHLPPHRAAFAAAAKLFYQEYSRAYAAPELETYSVRHTLGCLLARVAGRSTLEYLNDAERLKQYAIVVALMHDEPACLNDLIDEFIQRLL